MLSSPQPATFINFFIISPIESTAKPIKGLEPDKTPEIPRKPRKEPVVTETNGSHALVRPLEPESGTPKDLKRPRIDDNDLVSAKKRAKMVADDDVVIVDDDVGTGAITIDD